MKNSNGVSLLEVLVAMVLLSVGLLGLAPMLVMSIEANSMSKDALEVSSLAKDKLELYENASALPALPYKETEVNLDNDCTRLTEIWDNTTDSLIPDGLCCVRITMSWQDNVGASRSAQYSTYLGKL